MTTKTEASTDFLKTYRHRIEACLDQYLPAESEEPTQLYKAMRYAVLGKGKRIRPLLVYATGLSCNAPPKSLDPPAAAVEFIHAYSLIHDDLPAMDDDDFRRGQPSCHTTFGEATAILAGDALQSLAFELLSKESSMYTASQQLRMIHTLTTASGTYGMVAGQQFDLDSKNKCLEPDELEKLNVLKTGALIKASVKLGAITADAKESHVTTLEHFATMIGLAFQMQDDIFDADHGVDIDTTKKRLEELFESALAALDDLPGNTFYLRKLTELITNRSF